MQLHFDLKIYFVVLKQKWTLLHKLKSMRILIFDFKLKIENQKTSHFLFYFAKNIAYARTMYPLLHSALKVSL